MCMDGLQNAHIPSEMISISKRKNVLNHNFLLRKLKLLKETTRSQKNAWCCDRVGGPLYSARHLDSFFKWFFLGREFYGFYQIIIYTHGQRNWKGKKLIEKKTFFKKWFYIAYFWMPFVFFEIFMCLFFTKTCQHLQEIKIHFGISSFSSF